jgi:hypothetical protein
MDNEVDNEPFEVEKNLELKILVGREGRGYLLCSQFGEYAGIIPIGICNCSEILEEMIIVVIDTLKNMMVPQYKEEVRKSIKIEVVDW